MERKKSDKNKTSVDMRVGKKEIVHWITPPKIHWLRESKEEAYGIIGKKVK